MKTEYLIFVAVIALGIVVGLYASSKLGLNSYEEYPV